MIKSLTSLRGIFILFIFFHHCMNIYPGGGSMAVTFFFVLGGFGLTLGYKDRVLNQEFSYRQYITKRCIKFYPLHWLCLIATIPLVGLPLTLKQGGVFMANAALMQTLLPIKSLFFSYNAVSWYLADTLIFAALFPLLVRWILKASPKGRMGIAILFAVVYIAVAVLIPTEWYHTVLYISPYMRLTDFVFGIYLALGYLKIKSGAYELKVLKQGTFSFLIIIGLIALLVVESCLLPKPIFHIAPVYWILVALIIVTASLSTENGRGGYKLLENNYLQRLGELSFTIFLIHDLVLRYAMKIYVVCQINQPIVYISSTLILTVLISYFVEKYILTPFTQWLTKKIQRSMTAQS